MPAERRYGMDHEHYAWSPISTRGVLRWPEPARVALCVVVNLEHMEWEPPPGYFEARRLTGGLGRLPSPDYVRLTHREYGHRVGIFRVLDVLEKHRIPATIAMDALTAEHYPYLVRHCRERGAEFIGHGVSVSRMITSNMSEAEERDYIRTAIDTLQQATGSVPLGKTPLSTTAVGRPETQPLEPTIHLWTMPKPSSTTDRWPTGGSGKRLAQPSWTRLATATMVPRMPA